MHGYGFRPGPPKLKQQNPNLNPPSPKLIPKINSLNPKITNLSLNNQLQHPKKTIHNNKTIKRS